MPATMKVNLHLLGLPVLSLVEGLGLLLTAEGGLRA